MKWATLLGAGLAAAILGFAPAKAPAGAEEQTVGVNLSEFKITSAQLRPAVFGKAGPLKPGQTRFTFRNSGKFPHNFSIIATSPGATKFKTPDIAAGKSTTLTVNLEPGAQPRAGRVSSGLHHLQRSPLRLRHGATVRDRQAESEREVGPLVGIG